MTYREKLKEYQEGNLSEEETKKVEEEIEKYQAISDYLFESEEIPELQDLLAENQHEEQDFVMLVNQSIKKAFRKLGCIILAVALAVLLFLQFLLPHLVSTVYYDPGKKNGEYNNQMSLDMAVFSELFLPGKRREKVSVVDKGYGDYEINIMQHASYNGSFTNTAGEIKKGKIRFYDDSAIRRPTGNAFAWSGAPGDGSKPLDEILTDGTDVQCAAGTPEDAKETLENLVPGEKYIGYVSLNHIMDYETFMAYLEKQEDLGGIWCAVDTGQYEEDHFFAGNIGFTCDLEFSSDLEWDEETYPELILWNPKVVEERGEDELQEKMKTEEFMKTHVCSMMNYMADQSQFYEMMGGGSFTRLGLENAVEHIQKEGIRIYGYAAVMDKDKALELNSQEEVYEIYVENLR